MSFTIFQNEQTLFQAIKSRSSKVEKLTFLQRAETIFQSLLCLKLKKEEFSTFCQKSWANPVGKSQVLQLCLDNFRCLEMLLFFRILSNFIVRNFLPKKQPRENFSILHQNHGLIPFENSNFALCLKKLFFISRGGLFFVIMLTNNIFPGILCQNITRKFSFQIFEKSLAIPFENIGNFFLQFLT